jgi:hypothetical protein
MIFPSPSNKTQNMIQRPGNLRALFSAARPDVAALTAPF